MEGYEGYVESEGIRSIIIESIMQKCGLDREYGEQCIVFLLSNLGREKMLYQSK